MIDDPRDDDAAPRQPDGAGGPRKPRIEVLRATPAAAAQPVAPPASAEPRAHVFGGAAEREPYVAAPVAAARQPERPHERSRPAGGGLLRSPAMLLAMLALAVVIGAVFYTSMQRGPDVVFDVGNEGGTGETAQVPAGDEADGEAAPDPVLFRDEPPAPPAATREVAQADPAPPTPADRDEPQDAEPETRAEDEAPPADAAPASAANAVATVRAFYSALSAGDGGSAAQLVVPAKRRSGPLSAGALTRYYSSFSRPLRVRRVAAVDADTVRVAYDYVLADGRLCRGTAAVDVVQSGDRGLVSGIRTQGRC